MYLVDCLGLRLGPKQKKVGIMCMKSILTVVAR